jgi:hypothetical protein
MFEGEALMLDSTTGQPTAEEVAEERRQLRWVRILADLTVSTLYQEEDLSLSEAMQLVSNTRKAMLAMFPGKELAYDLLYRPRFDRVIGERFHRRH